jgi:hypothetical protein
VEAVGLDETRVLATRARVAFGGACGWGVVANGTDSTASSPIVGRCLVLASNASNAAAARCTTAASTVVSASTGRAVVAGRAAGVGLVLAGRAPAACCLLGERVVEGTGTNGAVSLRDSGVVLAGRAVVAEVLAVQVLVGADGTVVAFYMAAVWTMVARGAVVACRGGMLACKLALGAVEAVGVALAGILARFACNAIGHASVRRVVAIRAVSTASVPHTGGVFIFPRAASSAAAN